MLKRFGRKEGLYSLIGPGLFYLSLVFSICYAGWPYFYYVKNETLITIGLFASWRYSWQCIHYVRAFIYRFFYYPVIRIKAGKLATEGGFPDRIYFIIPSYNEEPWVSVETFSSIMSEMNRIPSSATLLVATGSDEDDAIISRVYNAHPARYKVELVLQRQRLGKRIAMGHALRAVARRYNDTYGLDENSVTVFMDGDSYLESKILDKTIPFFRLLPRLGAVTTNELAYIHTKSQWYKDWFNLKFGQRHILFQSHSLSRKVLTLTGRFSIFRTSIVIEEDFIRQLENDILVHPFHGKFRFLMGDDKSSWFYLLKTGWDMLYVPDAVCYSLESRDVRFLDLSTSLPYRWYGNTLRNNSRSLALGWKRTGFFIWLCILDQRISMWTSLVGLTGAILLSIFRNPIYLPIFIAWVLFVRTIQMGVIAFNGHPVSLLTIPIMLYNQWVGAVIKIKAFFNLSDQKWSKGKVAQDSSSLGLPVPHIMARWMPRYLMVISYCAFFFILLVTEEVLSLPDVHAVLPGEKVPGKQVVLDALLYGIIPDDGKDDAKALNKLIASSNSGSIIKLAPGTYDIFSPVRIERSDLIVEGAGTEKTVLLSHLHLLEKSAVLSVSGSMGKKIGQLAEDIKPNQSIAKIVNYGAVLKEGDIVLLRQPNDTAFFEAINSKRWRRPLPFIRQSMVKIQNIVNDLVFFDRAMKIQLESEKTQVYKPVLVKNVTVRNMTIIQAVPDHSIEEAQYRYENMFPDYSIDLFVFFWATQCKIENVALINAGRHPLVFENVYDCDATDMKVDGAWNKGGGGSGYVKFSRAYKCSFKDSTVRNIRHITLQWSAAQNIIDNIHSSVDINIHGGYPHNNTVSNIYFSLPPEHKWKPVTLAPPDAHWAPPNGPDNIITRIHINQ